MTNAYPLAWPDGWPRTPAAKVVDGRHQFKRPSNEGWRKPWTFAAARDALRDELRRMDAKGVVLSTNFQLNQAGQPRGDRRPPADQAVAIYFTRNGRTLAMACDRYTRAEENMRSLALALDAMRQLERHGGGHMAEKAFTGFAALPPPKTPWEVLGIPAASSRSAINTAFREKALQTHPDHGGSSTDMAALNDARDRALKEAQ